MGCDFVELAVSGVRSLSPYQPGKPVEELAREQGLDVDAIVKLASNENPLGPAPSSLDAIGRHLSELARYPDGNLFNLRDALSQKLAIQPEQITFGNGSNDVLVLLAQSWLQPGVSAVFSEYAFVVYPIAVTAAGAESIVVPARNWGHDLDAMADAVRDDTRMIFLANPNNPTGTAFTRDELTGFLNKVRSDVIVVLDEAYFEYVQDERYPDGVALLKQYPNLVVTRTFSKAYGLAGSRVGYAVSSVEMAGVLNKLRQPFNVNNLGECAAVAVLNDDEYLQRSRDVNTQGLQTVAAGLRAMGFEYIPSMGNFITFDTGGDARVYYQKLLEKGVIVRPVANYGMPGHLRVSIGLPEENERFLQALKEVKEVVS
ncbi:histidinol-phosphate transaminase [Endozoicomonas gorgoniicola]|uniref:Histidinol-phosphate aminotransferase n=1 Tax=Endozoicomonas gorgoniicola TaxID=1234144 RepID=A0ABT3MS97_9GAMM|nr:histidinol-phosphate transaminase [Endozoicomonas gorgoniicola]MCW7552242.1 histidinol-phosphate transaminase [Endozoicomonas gorgoniicola]